jgi:hypothetical protein
MQLPAGCVAEDLGAELADDLGVEAGRELGGAGAALVAIPRASCPSVPSTSVTRCTDPVWTSVAPGTAAATAFAALCCPGGYSTAVAVAASVESTAATANPA